MRLTRMLLTLAVSLVMAGCEDPAGTEESFTLTVDPQSVTLGPEADSRTLSVLGTGDWNASASDDWLSVDPLSAAGSATARPVTVSVQANTGGAPRTGKVFFMLANGKARVEVSVTQTAQEPLSIAEFIAKPVSKDTWYLLRATVVSIESYDYGDFYVNDGTGEILVYGLTAKKAETNDKSFASLGVKESDILTFMATRADYHGSPQAGGTAYYVSHEAGPALPPVYADYKAPAAAAGWLELPATSATDDWIFLHHGMQIGTRPFRNYSVEWNRKDLVPMWVAYPLTRESIGYGKRTDAWGLDPLLEAEEQPYLANRSYYPTNSYTRGHQVPSADRLGYEANKKTFYGTNMAPQNSDFNEYIWGKLEEKVRSWAKASDTDTLYVVSGCILDGSTLTVGDNKDKKVTVPTYFYKVLLRLSNGHYDGLAVLLEHKNCEKQDKYDYFPYALPIDALEELTGMDFFVNLPADDADYVESHVPARSDWWWK